MQPDTAAMRDKEKEYGQFISSYNHLFAGLYFVLQLQVQYIYGDFESAIAAVPWQNLCSGRTLLSAASANIGFT